MQKLAGAIVLTAQGVPFLHAGSEMARTKYGDENSFESPDSINRLDWDRKNEYLNVYEYYQYLIQLRKNHPAFRMTSTEMIQRHLEFLPTNDSNIIAYLLKDHANGDSWESILVVYNGNKNQKTLGIPSGDWTIALDGHQLNEKGLGKVTREQLEIQGRSAMVLYY